MLTFREAAEALDLPVKRIDQYVRDGHLVHAVGTDGVRVIPADFLQDGEIVKHLRAVITLLRDAHYTDPEVIDWLFRPDDSLPGTPIEALRANRGSEVKRRAQVAGF